jgi:hypothetical protein
MKTGFYDPNSGKDTKPSKTPWDFRSPSYDERSSCFLNAGTDHGIGHRVPVGHDARVKQRVPCLPYGKVNTMEVDEPAVRKEKIEMVG